MFFVLRLNMFKSFFISLLLGNFLPFFSVRFFLGLFRNVLITSNHKAEVEFINGSGLETASMASGRASSSRRAHKIDSLHIFVLSLKALFFVRNETELMLNRLVANAVVANMLNAIS